MRSISLPGALLAAALLGGCDNPAGGGESSPRRLAVMEGDGQQGPVATQLPQPLVVRVMDEDGRPMPGRLVSFRVTAGGGRIAAGAALTDAQGDARDRWTLGTMAGDTQRVEAVVADAPAGAEPVTAVFRAVGTAGPPAALTPVSPPAPAGFPGMPLGDSVAVLLRDAYGNAVTGHSVAWTVTAGGGSVSPAASPTNAAGVAKTAWTLGGGTGEQRLQGAASVGMTATFVATSQPGGGTIAIASGSGQSAAAGAALAQPLVVEVRRNGVPAPGVAVVWSAAPEMGTVTPVAAVTDAAGRVQAVWTLGTAPGAKVVTASAAGMGSVVFSATAVGPTPGPVMIKVSGDGQAGPPGALLPQPLVVEVRQNGLPVEGAVVLWQTYGEGSATPPAVTTDARGRAETHYTLGTRAGSYSIDASIQGVNAAVRFTSTVNLGGPALVAGNPARSSERVAPMGGVDTAYVLVYDMYWNPVPGATVSWTVLRGGGTITGTSVTDSSGTASAVWRFGRTERSQIVRADVPGVAPGTVTLLAPVTPPESGPPAQLQKVSGDNQTTTLAVGVPQPLVVRVVDAQGRGVGGADVRWDGIAHPTYATDSLGYSRARLIGHRSEPQPVTHMASLAGMESVTFTVNTTLGPPGRLVADADTMLLDVVGGRWGRPGFVLYDAQGRVALRGGGSRLDATWSFVDNTGVAVMAGSGNLSFWLEPLRDGEDRIEIRRPEGADTVRLIVRQNPVRMYTHGALSLGAGQWSAVDLVDANHNRVPGARWTSSDPSVVTVEDGRYTAVSRGVAVITGEKNGVSLSIGVTVF